MNSKETPHKMLLSEQSEMRYVHELNESDTASILEIEKEAYSDNLSLIAGEAGAAHQLAKAEFAKSAGLPALCLKFEKDGVVYGYTIAYESVYRKLNGILPVDTPYIYIADFAVRNQKTLSGSRVAFFLACHLLQKYKKIYLDADNIIPIVLITREHTSRILLRDAIFRIGKSLGIQFIVSEVRQFKEGADTMYYTHIDVSRI